MSESDLGDLTLLVARVRAYDRALGHYEAREECARAGCMYCREWLKQKGGPPSLSLLTRPG